MEEITIEDKIYISSKRAAKITGYAKDYVGQLCREGRVEARLVGRSWYVLEDSIREHRFGAKIEEPEPVREEIKPENDVLQTWKRPEYAAMEPVLVPEFAPKTQEQLGESKAVADMQSAWKEWFLDKGKEQQKALPDGSDDFRDEYLPVVEENLSTELQDSADEEVVISRIKEETPANEGNNDEEIVPIHRSYEAVRPNESINAVDLKSHSLNTGGSRSLATQRPAKGSSTIVVRSALLVVAFVAVAIAFIGTGSAEQILSGTSLKFGPQEAAIDFLGGTRTLNK